MVCHASIYRRQIATGTELLHDLISLDSIVVSFEVSGILCGRKTMKNQPIWESSGRPLYIRSVWMEAQKGGIRGHRHYLLEEQCKAKKNVNFELKKAHTFDCDDFSSDVSFELVGSSKNQQDSRTYSKPFLLNRNKSAPGYRTFDEYSSKGLSKTSSLQDIPSVLSTSSHQDEKLAERVLQWMDLAKKSDPTSEHVEHVNLPSKKYKPLQPRPVTNTKRPSISNRKLRDPIKNVTIMFNKDIYSAKYNRVPRLNVHSNRKSSAGISSAKLPLKPIDKTDTKKKERPKSCVTFEDELITDSEWSKKEIHIFIPSLPKNICGSNTFTEESLSTLYISDNKELP